MIAFCIRILICRISAFKGETSGATAIEFAILAPVFLAFIGAIIGHSFVNLKISHLDYTAYEVGSQVRISDIDAVDLIEFRDEVVCPLAGVLFTCEAIEVGVQSDPSFTALQGWRTADLYGDYCPGTARDIVIIALRYKLQGIMKSLYFGFTDVGDNGDYYISSKYMVAREPTITTDRLCS